MILFLASAENKSNASGAQVIGGAIFETKLDLTHPLAFGFEHEMLPVFRNHTMFMKRKKGRAMNPVVYTDKPLLAGYISDENEELLQNSAAVAVHTLGRGRIISMVDNPNFRAFWYGTNKLFFNALFFGDSVSASSVR